MFQGLVVTSAMLVVTGALLVVTRTLMNSCFYTQKPPRFGPTVGKRKTDVFERNQ